jgi:hypothetical protein
MTHMTSGELVFASLVVIGSSAIFAGALFGLLVRWPSNPSNDGNNIAPAQPRADRAPSRGGSS